jgi:hypothetical protein
MWDGTLHVTVIYKERFEPTGIYMQVAETKNLITASSRKPPPPLP